MAVYEIRLRKSAQTSVFRTVQPSDFGAICCAQEIGAGSDSVEVWKGMDRIFASGACFASPSAQVASVGSKLRSWLTLPSFNRKSSGAVLN